MSSMLLMYFFNKRKCSFFKNDIAVEWLNKARKVISFLMNSICTVHLFSVYFKVGDWFHFSGPCLSSKVCWPVVQEISWNLLGNSESPSHSTVESDFILFRFPAICVHIGKNESRRFFLKTLSFWKLRSWTVWKRCSDSRASFLNSNQTSCP